MSNQMNVNELYVSMTSHGEINRGRSVLDSWYSEGYCADLGLWIVAVVYQERAHFGDSTLFCDSFSKQVLGVWVSAWGLPHLS